MFLLVGLGNPGPSYAGHRHNIGFMAIDAIVRYYAFSPFLTRFQALATEGIVAGSRILIVKPLTYMNSSGQVVSAIVRFFKIPLDQVIVFHDELDLPPGKVRVKKGGSNAGHNGLKSIDAYISRDYQRVRLGIGHPGQQCRVIEYVLHDFDKADYAWLRPLLEAIANSLPALLSGDGSSFTIHLEKSRAALQ